MRIVVARCQVDYAGRLTAHLPMATRVLMIKADGSVLVHSDGGSYKPLNWMSPPCTLREGTTDEGVALWTVTSRTDDTLRILIEEVLSDTARTSWASTPACRRTASRSTSRSCWPSTRPTSATG